MPLSRGNCASITRAWSKQQVSRLPDIVDAASLDEIAAAGNGGGPDRSVDWATSSQQAIAQSFDWTERPTTLLVKYAQEELWVYQALCNVIKAANEGAGGRHDAVVQEINSLEIAYDAVEDAPGGAGQNRVEAIGGSAAPAGGPGGAGGPGAAATSRPDPKTRGKHEGGGTRFCIRSCAGEAAAAAPPIPMIYGRAIVT